MFPSSIRFSWTTPVALADLRAFRRVYAPEADALAVHLESVAVKDAGGLGCRGAGGEEQGEQEGHGAGCSGRGSRQG